VQEQNHHLLLHTEALTKRFPLVVANDAISFDVRQGEIHCLLGENGAGKSTLAGCLYGVYRPDAGQVFFKGQPVTLSSPNDAIQLGVGMVHQHFVLVPPLTVIENIVVGTDSSGVLLDLRQAEQKLTSLCETYGMDLDLRAEVWQLSVGEQQWVEILKALYMDVELLILDEPTAVLTPQETDKFFSILKQMRDDGLSIVFITHKLREVMEVSDRVTILQKGKHVATVNTAEVTQVDLACMMVGREVVFRIEKEALPPGEPVLEIKELRARNDKGQPALQGIDLTVHQHEIVGIAGIAGNGQKELFEVVVGVRRAEEGQVLLDGEDVTGISPRSIMAKGVAHVPADRIHEGLVMEFSVAENLILGSQRIRPRRWGLFLEREAMMEFARECISSFEITTPSPDQSAQVLSGGNLQKVILARELSQQPRCLIANQPTRGLDVGAIEYVHRRLLEQRGSGVGILLFSEDLEELFNLADRIAVLFKGQIMGVFDTHETEIARIGLLMAGIEEEIQCDVSLT
jgi:simple sugar transport system ATP-binding protein